MRIEKRVVNASTSCESCDTNKKVESQEDIEARTKLGGEAASGLYKLASRYVHDAIDTLGPSAQSGDKFARETIANLGVILMDLDNFQRMSI